MKYTPQEYVDCGFYSPGENETNYSSKVVKIRKERICAASFGKAHTIAKGDYALREVCILEGDGWQSAWTCLKCLDQWIDEHPKLQLTK